MLGRGADHPQLSITEFVNDYNYTSTTLLCRMAEHMEHFKFYKGLKFNQNLSNYSFISVTQNSSFGVFTLVCSRIPLFWDMILRYWVIWFPTFRKTLENKAITFLRKVGKRRSVIPQNDGIFYKKFR
jgi:hypothetical protein